MIIRSDWRGEPRITSAPNREISKREPIIDIISMAQHARPKLIGQIAFLRPQLIAFPMVVSTMDSPSSSSSGSWSIRANNSGGWLRWNFVSASTNPLCHGRYTGKRMTYADLLERAAAAHGIEPEYTDTWGHRHRTPEEVTQAILAALGFQTASAEEMERDLEERAAREWARPLDPTLVVREDADSIRLR